MITHFIFGKKVSTYAIYILTTYSICSTINIENRRKTKMVSESQKRSAEKYQKSLILEDGLDTLESSIV